MHVTLIRFTVRLLTPGAVTTPGRGRRDEADAIVDLDHRGRPHLPGTSLAGALRQAVRDVLGEERAIDLFGTVAPPADDGGSGTATASRLWVHSGRLVDENGNAVSAPAGGVRTRTSTAIDRDRAAARLHTLRSEELLPAGTRFAVGLRWDEAEAGERDDFLAVLAGWQPRLGRGISRGRGRCAVGDLLWGELDLHDPADLLTWASTGGPDLYAAAASRRPELSGDTVRATLDRATRAHAKPLLDVRCELCGPLLIGSGASETVARPDDTTPDGQEQTTDVALPLVEGGVHIVPGSALKGVLRSRVEYILRTLDGDGAACRDQRCGACLPCRTFGHGGGDSAGAIAVGARGLVVVDDAAIDGAVTRRRTHVAIDRFTGGAAPGLLFTDEVVEAGAFRIRADDLGLDPDDRELLLALLRLVFQDLHDGLIGIGRSTARGYGSLTPAPEGTGASLLPTLEKALATLDARPAPEVTA